MRVIPALLATSALLAGCRLATPDAPTFSPPAIATCEEAFRLWVDQAGSLNNPDADIVELVILGEAIQRRVFELCTLEQAERHNEEMPIAVGPGISEPLIQPDFRTFAEIECVDEAPLLDGTGLCAEVGR